MVSHSRWRVDIHDKESCAAIVKYELTLYDEGATDRNSLGFCQPDPKRCFLADICKRFHIIGGLHHVNIQKHRPCPSARLSVWLDGCLKGLWTHVD